MAGKRRRTPRGGHAQHFLRRGALASSLVREIDFARTEQVIDIGAGAGALTAPLAHQFERVCAVEIDRGLCQALRRRFAHEPRVRVVERDFSQLPLPDGPYAAVGNLPFRGSSAILDRLVHATNPPHDIVAIVEDRPAARLAGHASRGESVRSLWLKVRWHIEITRTLGPSDFEPAPHAHAAVIWLAHRPRPLLAADAEPHYQDFVADAFARPEVGASLRTVFTRNQLRRLSVDLGVDPQAPPSSVPFEYWLSLFRAFVREVPSNRKQRVAGCRHRLPRGSGAPR